MADDSDLNTWLDAMRPYVISHDIWSEFQFYDLLGQGSYGKVYLAKKSGSSQTSGNRMSGTQQQNA